MTAFRKPQSRDIYAIDGGPLPSNPDVRLTHYGTCAEPPFALDLAALTTMPLPDALRNLAEQIERIPDDDTRGRPCSASLILSDDGTRAGNASILIGVAGRPPSLTRTRSALASYSETIEMIINSDNPPLTPAREARIEKVNITRVSLAALQILAQSSADPDFDGLARHVERHVGVPSTEIPLHVLRALADLFHDDYAAWLRARIVNTIARDGNAVDPHDSHAWIDLRAVVHQMRANPFPGDRA